MEPELSVEQQRAIAIARARAAAEADRAFPTVREEQVITNPDLPPEFGGDPGVKTPKREDMTPYQIYEGVIESLNTITTGALGEVAGMAIAPFVGAYRGTNDIVPIKESITDAMTMKPGESGQRLLEPVGEFLQDTNLWATEAVPAAAAVRPAGFANRVVDGMQDTPTGKQVRRYEAAENSTWAQNPREHLDANQKLERTDEGYLTIVDDPEAEMLMNRLNLDEADVEMLKYASPETRKAMLQMAEDGLSLHQNRGSTGSTRATVGEYIGDRANLGYQVLREQGKRIDQIANDNADVMVDITPVREVLDQKLTAQNIKINEDGTLDFGKSAIPPDSPSAQGLQELYNRVDEYYQDGGAVSFKQAHIDKQFATELANFSRKETGAAGKADAIFKDIRHDINEVLRASSDDYKVANDKYSDAVEPFRQLAKQAGDEFTDFDADSLAEVERLALRSRSLTNNTVGGVNLNDSLERLDAVIADNGAQFKPEQLQIAGYNPETFAPDVNLRELSTFAAHLDKLDPSKGTSLMGIRKATNGMEEAVDPILFGTVGNAGVALSRGLGGLWDYAFGDANKRADMAAAYKRESGQQRVNETWDSLLQLLGKDPEAEAFIPYRPSLLGSVFPKP